MKIRFAVMALLLVGFLFGCASKTDMDQLRLGMSRTDVISILGEPTSASEKGDLLYLKYRFATDGLFHDDYYVLLQDGAVTAYGQMGDFGLGR